MADQPNDNVFNGEGTPVVQPPAATPPAAPNLDDLLANIKNESGEQKYKSLQDALIALDNSQKYIPQLKSQLTGTEEKLKEMQEKIAKFGNIDETVQRLLAQQRQSDGDTPPQVVGLDEQAVLNLVKKSLSMTKQAEMFEANQKRVNDALLGKFGEKAIETLDAKAAELHTTRQALGELAKQNPDLVLALFPQSTVKDHNLTVSSRRTLPPTQDHVLPPKPEKSLLSGASSKEQAARFAQLRDSVKAKYGIDDN